MTNPKEVKPQPTKDQAVSLLWKRGNLSWKLDSTQKELCDFSINNPNKKTVWICSRRLGKSYALIILAVIQCITKANSVVKYISPKQNMSKKNIRPLMRIIIEDCPKSLKPSFKTQENVWRFPNGSEIQLAGTDGGNAENIRGGSSDLCIVDEAGFCDDLKYIINSILLPTTMTTKGKIILSTTPPKETDHEFHRIWEEAEAKKTLIFKDIYSNVRMTTEEIEEYIEQSGGRNSQSVRRELFCERIMNEDENVIPEFTKELEHKIVQDWERPPHYDRYVSGDIGFKDLTVLLFAYFDFRKNKLIVEDEIVMNGPRMTTDTLAQAIKDKELELWGDIYTNEPNPPYMRVCDNDLILINDLYHLHDITFFPAQKDDAEAAINNMRIHIAGERVIINPKCEVLIRHMKNARWKKNRKTYVRSPDDGHYDAVDALKYLIRHVDYRKNPYPINFGLGDMENMFFGVEYGKETNPLYENFKKMFSIRKSIKKFKSDD